MAESDSKTSTGKTQPTGNLVFFDDRTALHLTQAFGQEADLEALLALLFKQMQALGNVTALKYVYKPLRLNITLGDSQTLQQPSHSADYNLSFREVQLGQLVLFFRERYTEHDLQTCEDLVSMAFISLRNALTILELRNQPKTLTDAEQQTLAGVAPLRKEEKCDALILLALDDYSDIQQRDGEEWAQILMSSVHEQIREGLRDADGVYHIGDDLIAVLLPNTTGSQAQEVACKVRTLVASLHLNSGDIGDQLTACMGVSDASTATTAEEVMEHAKLALADAQAAGRSQISFYQKTPAAQATG